jgi:hypothetical protein
MTEPMRHEFGPDPAGSTSADEQLLGRIRGEYLEMPGLRLTRRQAQRLWGLDDDTSARLLSMLVELKFLTCAPDGAYVRLSEGALRGVPLRMAKAEVDLTRDVQPAPSKGARRP